MATRETVESVKEKLPPWEIPVRKSKMESPPTNRGGKTLNLSVDYLTFTARINRHLQRIQRSMLIFFTQSMIRCRTPVEIRSKAFNNYKFGWGAYLGGKLLCTFCWGGNQDTFMVDIKGGMCRFVTPEQWLRFMHFIENLNRVRITRCDLAADFFQGQLCARCAYDVWCAAGAEFLGLARKRGRLPKARWIEGGIDGSTLYIGKGTRREICIYEKGRQLGFFDEPWVRAEVKYRRVKSGLAEYHVPLEILDPENWWSYWAASADYLARLTSLAKQIKYGPVELDYDDFLDYLRKQAWHCRNQYGGLIGFLTSICGASFTCRLLGRSKWIGVDLFPGWDDFSPYEIKSVLGALPAVLDP